MNIYQDSRSLLWIREVKLDGRWYRERAFGTYGDAGTAPIWLMSCTPIDGPSFA